MAQLFEKVELRGEEELLKIQRLLEEAVDRRLQVRTGSDSQPRGGSAGPASLLSHGLLWGLACRRRRPRS